jgi:hypothetical protein
LAAIKADYAHNMPIALSEPIITNNLPEGWCAPGQSLSDNLKAVEKQMPYRDPDPARKVYLPERSGTNLPWVLDPSAAGSLANMATKSTQSINDLQNCTDATIRSIATLAKEAAAGKTSSSTYTALVGALLTTDFVKAMSWNEVACRDFVINHEIAHAVLQNIARHDAPGEARFNAMFSPDGTPNPDGLGLLMTLANQGKSQADGIQDLINLLSNKIRSADGSDKTSLENLKRALTNAQSKFPC